MADLVEAGRGDGESEDEQQQLRACGTPARSPTATPLWMSTNQTDGERTRRAPAPRQPRAEEERERRRQPLRHLRVGDEHLPAQRQQRVASRRRVVLGAGEQPLLGELLASARRARSSKPRPSRSDIARGELAERRACRRRLEQRVHQRPELHHLPVGAADERGAVLVARAVDLAEQLDALAPGRGRPRCGRLDRRRAGRRSRSCGRGSAVQSLLLGDAGVLRRRSRPPSRRPGAGRC